MICMGIRGHSPHCQNISGLSQGWTVLHASVEDAIDAPLERFFNVF